ncbi:hypothetical protein M1L60_24305 [Actinoplanes sp. TRM 88003]|uniref:Uncharacterized protein n=1 Tax=Paractinoplanes aksuensis TaxID=2939490 RepID=A0ABT1DSA8_9ACTN|nr:hypothetical protein [Actinoplanes aksuensis]MCO8273723.1 hypothetical protein [Actinoplanes aksuensis]
MPPGPAKVSPSHPDRRHEHDPGAAPVPHQKADHVPGRRVEPLPVVDDQSDRPRGRGRLDQADDGQPQQQRVPGRLRLLAERAGQGLPLPLRKPGSEGTHRVQQRVQAGEPDRHLVLQGGAAQHGVPGLGGPPPGVLEQGVLADAGRPGQEDGRRPVGRRGQQAPELTGLRLTTDHGGNSAAPRAGWHP